MALREGRGDAVVLQLTRDVVVQAVSMLESQWNAYFSARGDSFNQVNTQNFSLGGGGEVGSDPEAIRNLCLILKIVIKTCST
jgi:hypothetical protein